MSDPEAYSAWANEAQESSSLYHSPASSPKSSSSYESCSEGEGSPARQVKGKGIFASLRSVGGRAFGGASREQSTHATIEVDHERLKGYVKKAYKAIRFYHGTALPGARSIRSHGMRVRLKNGGPTALALSEMPNQPHEAIERARRYNYITTAKGAANSYAHFASVTSTQTWQPREGEDGTPCLVRLFKTEDFPHLEKDTDFPLFFAPFLNPLYRTQADIPAHAVRQTWAGFSTL